MDGKRTTESFLATGRSLEDAFFIERDRQLIARKAELRKMAETKEALASASGIKDPEVLDFLVKLNVRPETVAALSMVPLVEVVWADGKVDDQERQVVLEFARQQGIPEGSVVGELLGRWLEQRPEPALLAAWQLYIEALCERLSAHQRQHLKDELLRNVRAAAEASGGFLGIGKISSAEKAVLAKLESSFRGA
jgi:hypothetical protein